ncbi:hypothetical protein [Tsukamurella ocularis]|uniref:hypothetical protein n=1 Tax=Tsukamurella ocularis TaxID=1970234 RepID=UPI0021672BA2|nr:hypothetical protein [Tsukamurella ocularis]MCS3779453.1 hypothetical protein [Tsukamurella ocularis]MCS3788073.1 hypothetical protein [Tsukamurella ocularis]MCS3852389.1 hypothetical protein [Tsukamurella ocularis]
MTRLRLDDVLRLAAAAVRLGMREVRTAVRRTEIAPPFAPGGRIDAGDGAGTVRIADRAGTDAMARGLGMTGAQAARAWADGVLVGLTAVPAASVPVAFLCRIDRGTASAELHFSPRGAMPDGSHAALPVARVGACLLDRVPELRRVGVTIPDGHPLGAALVGEGFVDEGWAPPVRGTGDARMFTLLRE